MTWNWQQPTWPHFAYDAASLQAMEAAFLRESGALRGALKHLDSVDKESLIIDCLAQEAIKTSEIEGEILNRESVQSSIKQHFGLVVDRHRQVPLQAQGISDLLMDIYNHFGAPLSHRTLWQWHKMVCMGRGDLEVIGGYRTHHQPMQIVSGLGFKQKIYFEAPASPEVAPHMQTFVRWFNATRADGETPLPALIRAGIAHLYFVSIHPFEDGNGRIARGLAEMALSQQLGAPTLIALSQIISQKKREYYNALERNNQSLEITDWLIYFAKTVLQAQAYSISLIDFLIQKTKLFDRVKDQLNPRQTKVLLRMFKEGPSGFQGGLSADNYLNISGTSRATATRDLQELVKLGVLTATGQLKGTRYHLNIG